MKRSTRRHPWLARVDRIYELRELLEVMPVDHPNRRAVEHLLAETQAADPVKYLEKTVDELSRKAL